MQRFSFAILLGVCLTLVLLIDGSGTQARFAFPPRGSQGSGGPPPQIITSVPLSNNGFTAGSASGTVVGAIGAPIMSPTSPAFSGSCCTLSGADGTSFQVVGGNLETQGVLCVSSPPCTYHINLVATQGGISNSPFPQAETITASSQSIALVPLSGSTFPPSAPSGTVVGMIGTPIMSPTSPAFSGSCCTLSGADQASFQIIGSNLETQGVLCGSPPCTYHINLVATQSSASNSPFPQAETITSTTGAITAVSLQNTTFVANVPNIPVGAVMPTISPVTGTGVPFVSAPFTGSLSIVTSGLDSTGATCTTNGSHFQILSPSLQLAANGSGVAAGTYAGVCVQASQSGYASYTKAFSLIAGAAPANQIVLTNVSGSTISNYKYQFGRPFLDGAIASGSCPIININGSPAAQSQFDLKNAYPDGSWKFGVGATVIPTLLNNTPVTLTFTSGACNNTALTRTQMLASPFNFDGTETLLFPAAVLTGGPTKPFTGGTTVANWQAVTNGGFNITINGTPLTITGLNFSAITNQNQVAHLIQVALNADLGTTATQAVRVFNSGSNINANYMFVLGVVGSGASISAATSPGSGTDISTMLEWTSGTLASRVAQSTATVSGRTMLNNGNYALWTSGPVAQTIILADDSAGRAYDIGNGDGFRPFRPRIYATFWSADNSVSVRLSGGQDLTTESEDMTYVLTVKTGNSSPTTQDTVDLSATGYVGQTGLTAASAQASPGGALTVTGTLSGPPLTVGHSLYYFLDLNNSMWCQFTYTNSTTLTITDSCNGFYSPFTGTALPIAIGDTLVVGNPKQAWVSTEWIKGPYWINDTAPSPQVNIDQSLAYLEYTRAIPNFDATVTLSGSTITNAYSRWTAGAANLEIYDGDWDGGPVDLTTSVGSGGSSPWLGIMPAWQTYWLYSGAWQMRQESLQHADLTGSYPYLFRETDTTRKLLRGGSAGTGLGLPVSIYGRPNIFVIGQNPTQSNKCAISGVYYGYQFCGGASDNLPAIPGSADIANGNMWISMPTDHQVAVYYVPYIETGDPWYLNLSGLTEAQLQLGFGYRTGTAAYCYFWDEFRGEGWGILNLAQAAFISPDADPFTPWLKNCTNDTLGIYEGWVGITGTAYDGTVGKTWALGFGDNESSSGTPPSDLAVRAIPTLHQWENFEANTEFNHYWEWGGSWIPNVTIGALETWYYHYVSLAIGRATELGFAAGAMQTYMGQLYHDVETASPYSPYILSQYENPVEKGPAAGGVFFPDWPSVMAAYTTPFLTGVGWNMSVTSMVWNSNAGGQAALTTALPNAVPISVGGSGYCCGNDGLVLISGATNTGSAGNGAVNGYFPIVGGPDNQHFTISMPGANLNTTGSTNSNIHLTGIASVVGVNVGSAVAAGDIPQNLAAPATANMVSGSIHMTSVASPTPIAVGTQVFGPGIPAGDTVATVISSSAVDLAVAATATTSAASVYFVNNVVVTNIVSTTPGAGAVDISVPASGTNAGESLTFTNTVPGAIGTIGGSITAVLNPHNGGPASTQWSVGLTTSGEGGRQVWANPGEAMMTDNGITPWGIWFGKNVHDQIPDWSASTHWDIVPRTDVNTLPAQSTSTPP